SVVRRVYRGNGGIAVSSAKFFGVARETVRAAVPGFGGGRERPEIRRRGARVKMIEGFRHPSTAIAQTLTALRRRYPKHRLWAIFEPRSNTTRRAIFQHELPKALKVADGVFISQVARLEQIPEAERLNPEAVVKEIQQSGRSAFYEPNANAIIERIVPMLKKNDIVTVFSNGGFDGIHEKLLARLRSSL